MKVQIRYFASLREALGAQRVARHARRQHARRAARCARSPAAPRHAEVLARGRAVRCALAQRMCDEATPLVDGAEVAFFPPVTGG